MTLAERSECVQKGESHIRAKDTLFVLDCRVVSLLAMTGERGRACTEMGKSDCVEGV
jgi:hypothetical protein